MNARARLSLLFFAFSVAVYCAARWYFARQLQPLEIARAQIYAFPLFIAALVLLSERSLAIPRWTFLALVLLGYASIAYSYNVHRRSVRVVMVTPLKDDSFATQTRITYSALETASHLVGGPPSVISYDPVTTSEEAARLLDNDRDLIGVLWGDSHWITVTFGKDADVKEIGSWSSPWLTHAAHLSIISRMPSIGISYEPIKDTSLFISSLLTPTEDSLRAAAEQESPWTTNVHRSYASLLLGNLLLERALKNASYEYGMLDCVIDTYLYGWSHVETSEHPDLKNALLNNLAVAMWVQADAEGNDALRHEAQAWLRFATRSPKSLQEPGGVYYAPYVALKNYAEIRALLLGKQ